MMKTPKGYARLLSTFLCIGQATCADRVADVGKQSLLRGGSFYTTYVRAKGLMQDYELADDADLEEEYEEFEDDEDEDDDEAVDQFEEVERIVSQAAFPSDRDLPAVVPASAPSSQPTNEATQQVDAPEGSLVTGAAVDNGTQDVLDDGSYMLTADSDDEPVGSEIVRDGAPPTNAAPDVGSASASEPTPAAAPPPGAQSGSDADDAEDSAQVEAPTSPVPSPVKATDGSERHSIVISVAQQEALMAMNFLINQVPNPNPDVLVHIDPDNFRQGVVDLLSRQSQANDTSSETLDMLVTQLQPLCKQLHEVLQQQRLQQEKLQAQPDEATATAPAADAPPATAEAAAPAAATPAATAAPAAEAAGAASSEVSGGLRALPPRSTAAPRASSGAATPAAAASATSTATGAVDRPATTWTDVYGSNEPKEKQELRKQIQDLRVEAFRGFKKLGMPSTNAQLRTVIYRLTVSERMAAPVPPGTTRPPAEELALAEADRLEESGVPMKNRIVVVVLGATGVGKTSFIRRMLGQAPTDPFAPPIKGMKVYDGDVFGIPFRFIDTPGLNVDASSHGANLRILAGVKRMTKSKANKPHVYLYVDRMDVVRRDGAELSLLRCIANVLGTSAMYSAIFCLTHACSTPPEQGNSPMPYEMWSMRRLQLLHQRMIEALMDRRIQNPSMLVENNPACRTNAAGEPVLPNNTAWRVNAAAMLLGTGQLTQCSRIPGISRGKSKGNEQAELMRILGAVPPKAPPIGYLLQNLNQSKPPQKFTEDERSILTEAEIAALKPTDNEAAREEQRRRREFIKTRQDESKVGGDAAVAIPAPDPPLPPTFESTTNNYRYRYMEANTGWISRPFVDANGPDRSDGINGAQSEKNLVVRMPNRFIGGAPTRIFTQCVKDKDNTTLVAHFESSAWLNKCAVLTAAMETQNIQSDMLYQFRVEPRYKYFNYKGRKRLKTSAGLVASVLSEGKNPLKGNRVRGVRLEQRVRLHKKVKLGLTGVRIGRTQQDRGYAYGAETTFKDTSDPQAPELALSYNHMKHKRQGIHGATIAFQRHVTPETIGNARLQFSSSGQSTLNLRVTSHDKPQLAYAFVLPTLGWVLDKVTRRGQDAQDF